MALPSSADRFVMLGLECKFLRVHSSRAEILGFGNITVVALPRVGQDEAGANCSNYWGCFRVK